MINYEITYASSPHFVSHDSRGIEAGAESDPDGRADEMSKLRMEYIQKFIIHDQAQETYIEDQLHAIW